MWQGTTVVPILQPGNWNPETSTAKLRYLKIGRFEVPVTPAQKNYKPEEVFEGVLYKC